MTVHLNPYMTMNGNAKEAVAFYEKALEAQVIGLQTFAEMPADPNQPPMPPEAKDRVLHAMIRIGETIVMLSDNFPGMPYQVGNHLTIALTTHDVAQTRRYFEALAEGGQVAMHLQETFWSPAYGMVTDKFGMGWQITTELKG